VLVFLERPAGRVRLSSYSETFPLAVHGRAVVLPAPGSAPETAAPRIIAAWPAFGSDEWRSGPREAIVSRIESSISVVIPAGELEPARWR
jgi:hypothetical protein